MLGDFIKKEQDFELEDLTSSSFYYTAVKETYPELAIEETKVNKTKRTKQYEAYFKEKHYPGFNKRRVGETIKRLLNEKKGDEETKKNLQSVVDKIWETLQGQIKS